jgi:hypothetical protein
VVALAVFTILRLLSERQPASVKTEDDAEA